MKSERSMEAPVTSDKVPSPRIADRGSVLCFISIFAAALIVRMHGLGFNPYWMDEVTTLQRANYPLPKLLSDSLTFHHLPTYFLLISWLVPFDLHETLIRAPSALFGALTCAIGADISRLLGGMSAALTTGIFLALSPLQVAYGQEARPHALSVLLVAIALRGLIGLALDPAKASLRLSSPEANRIAWATFFFGTLAAVNVLGVALIWAAAAFIALLIIAYHPGCDRPQLLRNALVVYAGIVIITIPSYTAMYYFVRSSGPLLEGLDWIPPANAHRIWSDISDLWLMSISSPITSRTFLSGIPFMGALMAIFFMLGLLQLRGKTPPSTVLLVVTIFLPAALLALSLLTPIWLLRYLLWSAVPFFVIAGQASLQLPRRFRTLAVAIVGLLTFINFTPYYSAELKPRWDIAADSVRDGVIAGDLFLVTDSWAPRMLNLYLSRSGVVLPEGQWTTDVDAAAQRVAAGGRVQAVFGRVGQTDHMDLAGFRDRIVPLGTPVSETPAGLDVVIWLFAGRAPFDVGSDAPPRD
jgi:mannosyltransferase